MIADRNSFKSTRDEEFEAFLQKNAAPSDYRTSVRSKKTAVSSASKTPTSLMQLHGEANKRREREPAEPLGALMKERTSIDITLEKG